jgi:uracil-DNA glycosylase family 4
VPYLSNQRVEPDGPHGTWAVVGEGPANEELQEGKGFVGSSGRILWPIALHYAKLSRHEVYVTNLSKRPLSNEEGAVKLTPEEFEECRAELLQELVRIRPSRVLALGTLAAKALMGPDFTTMEACSGMVWESLVGGYGVIPTFHPAAAMRPGGDKLAAMAKAIQRWQGPCEDDFKEFLVLAGKRPNGLLALDTEGTPDDPICLTWACRNTDGKVIHGTILPKDVPFFWASHAQHSTVIWHNAPWDWSVVQAMGVTQPWMGKWRDTMELAFLREEPSKGLKALSWRYLGIKMRDFMDVVAPHYEEVVRATVEGRIEAGTEWPERLHKRTKKPLKPKPVYSTEAKKLRRLKCVDSMVKAIDFPPPSLRFVPDAEREAYAEQDAVSTLLLAERWA